MTPLRADIVQHLGLTELAAKLPKRTIMAEVGCYAGESAKIFLDSGNVLVLFAVDPWVLGYDLTDPTALGDMEGAEAYFDVLVGKRAQKIRKPSVEASGEFEDGSLDFVYLDACHQYEAVKADLLAWLPKIRKGGMIGGHDYPEWMRWPGVAQAVHEVLGEPDELFPDGSWLKVLP